MNLHRFRDQTSGFLKEIVLSAASVFRDKDASRLRMDHCDVQKQIDYINIRQYAKFGAEPTQVPSVAGRFSLWTNKIYACQCRTPIVGSHFCRLRNYSNIDWRWNIIKTSIRQYKKIMMLNKKYARPRIRRCWLFDAISFILLDHVCIFDYR